MTISSSLLYHLFTFLKFKKSREPLNSSRINITIA